MNELIVNVDAINARIESANSRVSTPRTYVGMSGIGDSCTRKLMYTFRHCFTDDIDARLGRIFATGHKAEDDFIADLKSAGLDVFGEQDTFTGVHGWLRGHCDGFVKGVPQDEETLYVLEMKTSNHSGFLAMKKKGVKESKYLHYCQMQIYGYKSGATKALYMMMDKNDSSYYFETIDIDIEFAKLLEQKAERVILEEELPYKIGSASWYECKFCNAYKICQLGEEMVKSCRNCEFVGLEEHPDWRCNKSGKLLENYDICESYCTAEFLTK